MEETTRRQRVFRGPPDTFHTRHRHTCVRPPSPHPVTENGNECTTDSHERGPEARVTQASKSSPCTSARGEALRASARLEERLMHPAQSYPTNTQTYGVYPTSQR